MRLSDVGLLIFGAILIVAVRVLHIHDLSNVLILLQSLVLLSLFIIAVPLHEFSHFAFLSFAYKDIIRVKKVNWLSVNLRTGGFGASVTAEYRIPSHWRHKDIRRMGFFVGLSGGFGSAILLLLCLFGLLLITPLRQQAYFLLIPFSVVAFFQILYSLKEGRDLSNEYAAVWINDRRSSGNCSFVRKY